MGGNSLPFGSLALESLSSSKNGYEQASKGDTLLLGVYSNNLLVNEIASCGILDLKTYKNNSWLSSFDGSYKDENSL